MGNCIPTSNHINCNVIPFEDVQYNGKCHHTSSDSGDSQFVHNEPNNNSLTSSEQKILRIKRSVVETYSCNFSQIIFDEVFRTLESSNTEKTFPNFSCDKRPAEINIVEEKLKDSSSFCPEAAVADQNGDYFRGSISNDEFLAIKTVDYELELIPSPVWQTRSSCGNSDNSERAVTIDESFTRHRNRPHHDISSSTRNMDSFFEDPDFGPDRRSLTFSGHPDFEKYLSQIVWKRPYEIHPEAKMIKEGMSRSDIAQQALGDCWFVAACSALADNRNLLSRVVTCHDAPLSGPRYSGSALKFQFHQNGDWIEVIIDDYLPVREYGSGRYQLIFSKSTDDSEMWVSLLEKAYAKLKGCYESLVGGNATCALSDLTGGITESLILEDEDASSVWRALRDVTAHNKSFATASCGQLLADGGRTTISEDEVGLLESHAYSVVSCVSFAWKGEKVKLIRLRNPWASFEYKANWSDRDKIWRDPQFAPIAARLGFKAKSDGEFFMEFSHFLSLFRGVTICTVEPRFSRDGEGGVGENGESFQESLRGEWIDGVNAGGCMNYRDSTFPINPQFYLQSYGDHEGDENTTQPSQYSCLISLLQFHPPSPTHKTQLEHIGLYVYELKRPKESKRKLTVKHFQYNPIYARNKIFTNFQETVVRMEMKRDRCYVIIPCTFQPGKNSQFLLRVYSNTPISLTELR